MRLTPICPNLHRSIPNWPHFRHFTHIGTIVPPLRELPRSDMYIFHLPDSTPLSIHCKSSTIGSFTRNRQLPLVRMRDPKRLMFFHNRIYINMYRQIQTLKCTYPH